MFVDRASVFKICTDKLLLLRITIQSALRNKEAENVISLLGLGHLFLRLHVYYLDTKLRHRFHHLGGMLSSIIGTSLVYPKQH